MSTVELTPRGLLHLLFNGARAIDVVETAHKLGMLEALEAGPVTLGALSQKYGMVPLRLYKFLDCLESLGLVKREQTTDALVEARYTAVPGLRAAAEKVVGPASLERDRERYAWKELHGHLPEVLRGERSMPRESFDWPPSTPDQVAGFEASMAAGLGPILEVFRVHGPHLWRPGAAAARGGRRRRLAGGAPARAEPRPHGGRVQHSRHRAAGGAHAREARPGRAPGLRGRRLPRRAAARGLRRAVLRARAARLARGDGAPRSCRPPTRRCPREAGSSSARSSAPPSGSPPSSSGPTSSWAWTAA